MDNTQNVSYFSQKKELLSHILSITEDFISTFANVEDYNEVLLKRQNAIDRISALEQGFSPNPMDACSNDQREAIDSLIKRIQILDMECVRLLQEARDSVLSQIKNNRTEQKVAQYSPGVPSASGRFLDYKK